ncbi:anaphase-promoting complex component Cut20/Apc4 [Colletotrichum graminicola]|uniref:Anaphase-promoting complex subunit 4 n=1 Tax=Colletotrichum graminicola (strain M1.001 / M2 / FGSC 10212) TaxID=645133 RepID=E3QCA4_COLGM|nr:anaphase-promoting complex component Cut20/Apc4 [Colletotrichum graminicola M1.001]EFQ28492.1 anaphase-promoting complex component Cut20/Apc4 [Colletotrichum graminicola M1.001]WDK16044.1 anaphase-promoting complex component Cut20/Apc4 [Colletotrichum graminicola]
MAKITQLRSYSETRFDHRVADGFPCSNPTVDLSVSWDATGKNLLIYRPREQVVSKIHQFAKPGQQTLQPQAVRWKPDGQFLAVGWSDGYVRLMGLENNKAAHHIRVCGDNTTAAPNITHIGWSRNTVGKAGFRYQKTSSQPWQKLMSEELELPAGHASLDFPRELTFLEVDSALPKISPLPSSSAGAGEDGLVFTLRTGIEYLFQPFNNQDSDQVFVMLVGTSDGHLHLSIYDSFVIGDFRYTLPSSMYRPGVLQLVQHASHPEVSTHALFLKPSADDDRALYLVPMDLPFIPLSPINISLLASKLTALQKLLRYVKQTQLHMQVEYKNTRDLPSKFLRSVEGDLEQASHGPTNIVQALFHTAITGHTYEPVREWLVDSLAERGHKRWDKAVVSGLENLRCLIHENMLPALERCAIILSRLRGLAQFYDSREDIGFTVAQISRAMDIVSCLTLVGHRILLNVMEELDLFNAFSTWMRFQIDRLAAPSSASEDLTEKEATMENSKVLVYVQRYLVESPMAVFFDEVSKEDYSTNWERADSGASMLEDLDTQLRRWEEGQPYLKAFPNVSFLVDYLTTRANGIFKDIAEAQKRSVRFGQPTKIALSRKIARFDSTMCPEKKEEEINGLIFAAVIEEGHDQSVFIFRTSIGIINGISSNVTTTTAALSVDDGKIVDVKFLNSSTLILLVCKQGKSANIVTIPVQSHNITYMPYQEGNLPMTQALSQQLQGEVTTTTLPEDPSFVPVRMDVQDASDARGEVPARVCVLGANRTTYKVFSLGSGLDDTQLPEPATPRAAHGA